MALHDDFDFAVVRDVTTHRFGRFELIMFLNVRAIGECLKTQSSLYKDAYFYVSPIPKSH